MLVLKSAISLFLLLTTCVVLFASHISEPPPPPPVARTYLEEGTTPAGLRQVTWPPRTTTTKRPPRPTKPPTPPGPPIDALSPDCGQFEGSAEWQRAQDAFGDGCESGPRHRLVDAAGQSRMAGAQPLEPQQAPFYAQLVIEFAGTVRICGGTIIHKSLVLTAAHCLMLGRERATAVAVITGASEIRYNFVRVRERVQTDGTKGWAHKYIIPPSFNNPTPSQHDLAVVRLRARDELTYGPRVRPACLARREPHTEAVCFALGRGILNQTNVVPIKLQASAMRRHEELLNTTGFWWRSLDTGATICSGDSGSGLMCYDQCAKSKPAAYVVGLASVLNPNSVCKQGTSAFREPFNYMSLAQLDHLLMLTINRALSGPS